MAGLEELWSRFSLTEEEEGGAEVAHSEEVEVHRLAGKFFTKQTLNADVVARTFKPLWKPADELKIRDIRESILLFEFEDVLDLERVLEYEPWSFNKSLVVFKKAPDVKSIPLLEFDRVTFWVQIHNVPEKSLNHETGEAIGKMIGSVIQVADIEDDGAGGEFLRVRVAVDITKPLPRCCKLRAAGKHLGWVGIRYERLPNFCYWCGRVSHSERDCEIWLRGKGSLKREEQQYGEWLRADQVRQSRKSVAVIPGSSRSQAPWGRKFKSSSGSGNGHSADNFSASTEHGSKAGAVSSMNVEQQNIEKGGPKVRREGCSKGKTQGHFDDTDGHSVSFSLRMERGVVGLTLNGGKEVGNSSAGGLNIRLGTIEEGSNQCAVKSVPLRTWKKIACLSQQSDVEKQPSSLERRPEIDLDEITLNKRQCMDFSYSHDRENIEVVSGSQHHQAQ